MIEGIYQEGAVESHREVGDDEVRGQRDGPRVINEIPKYVARYFTKQTHTTPTPIPPLTMNEGKTDR